MIRIGSETLLSLREAARRLPGRGGRRSLHVSAVYRWAQRGVRGVRLETIPVGGILYTSAEALQRFCEALAETQAVTVPVRRAGRAATRAMRELEEDGF